MELKKCPFCAEEINIDAIKCRFCGEFLEMGNSTKKTNKNIWICKKCKEEVDSNYDICWNCGADRNGNLAKETETEFNELKKDAGKSYSSGSGMILAFVILGLSLSVGVTIGFIWGDSMTISVILSIVIGGIISGISLIKNSMKN